MLHKTTKAAACLLAAWTALFVNASTYVPANISPPKPLREFRGAWIASVANIDWPSAKDLSTADQKKELIALLDRAAQLKLNVVILQVRPACDALYASQLEPWSEFLTGASGKPPQPFYDPLAFAVEEAHRRSLELHAWFNPYRAGHTAAKSSPAATHVTRTHPQWVRHYGSQVWLDPGDKEAQEHSFNVVMDVVRRYDIDGVHFDDYFYPYKETNRSGAELEFPDEPSWQKYGASSKLSRDDWRRENVNQFIQHVHSGIHALKPSVKFGVSPFGIWRPENPPSIKGFDAYEKLYADSRKWLRQGWVDYFAPQLYWAIDAPEQSFPVLLKWWTEQNPKDRIVVAGLDDTKTAPRERRPNTKIWAAAEILNQIRITRKLSGAAGDIHWNLTTLLRNDSLADALVKNVYTEPALTPAYPWLESKRPAKPSLNVVQETPKAAGSDRRLRANWRPGPEDKPLLWLLQFKTREWQSEIVPASRNSFEFTGTQPQVIAISAVDRSGNCSVPAVVSAH